MANLSRSNDPHHWHARAAQMRALADTMAKAGTKATMLKLADDYDKLGDRDEERREGDDIGIDAAPL